MRRSRRPWSRGSACQAILASGAAAAAPTTTTTGLCPPRRRSPRRTRTTSTRARGPTSAIRARSPTARASSPGCVSTTRGIVVHQYDLRTGEIVPRPPAPQQASSTTTTTRASRSGGAGSTRSTRRTRAASSRSTATARCTTAHRRAPYDLHAGLRPRATGARPTPREAWATPTRTRSPTRDKLWLFWRGGNWYPTLLLHARRRALGEGAHARPRPRTASARTRSTSAVPTGRSTSRCREGHPPPPTATSLYYVRYQGGRFYRADGRPRGTLRDLPLRVRPAGPRLSLHTRGWAAPGLTTSR